MRKLAENPTLVRPADTLSERPGLQHMDLVESLRRYRDQPTPPRILRSCECSPEEGPFAREGERARPGDVVGLVETMKTFSEVTAISEGRL